MIGAIISFCLLCTLIALPGIILKFAVLLSAWLARRGIRLP